MLSNSLTSSYFFDILLRKFIKTLENYKACICIILFKGPLSVWVDYEVIAKFIDLFRSDENMLDISGFKCYLCLIESLTGIGFCENR